jgi:hypothetical protein
MSEWKNVPHLRHHEVSETGQVRRTVTVRMHRAGRVLRPEITHRGYARYRIMESGKKVSAYAHRLVCEAFHGPPPTPQHQAAHRDGNKLHNHFNNLRWATPLENSTDQIAHGTRPTGESCHNAKLTWGAVEEIRAQCTGRYGEIAKMARKYGVTHGCVWRALRRATWRDE